MTSVRVTAMDTGNLTVSDSFDITVSVQNLTLSGTSGADTLVGYAGNDLLDGGLGADTMTGGLGNDTYVVADLGDVVTETSTLSSEMDTVQSSITYALGANIENLTLTGTAAINGTGNTLNNALTGNGGANTLSGGTGADTMIGGAGNDTYVVDNARDVVTENASEGTDLVQSGISYTLGANVENLTLTGTAAINGDGNTLSNVLTGNSGANVLNGAAGADTMMGGTGNDTYVVDNVRDVVTENASEGTDLVQSGISYTLGANVENLTLTGTVAINGTGNTLDNVLMGNRAANSLSGAAGSDTLDGGAGNDTLTGGTGNDTYLLGLGYGLDTVVENDDTAGNTDIAQFLRGVAADQIWFQHIGNNLEASIIGTADKLVAKDWYLGTANHIEQFKSADSAKTLLDSNVQNLVNAMASFAPPAAGQTTLPQNYQDALAGVIAANWQ